MFSTTFLRADDLLVNGQCRGRTSNWSKERIPDLLYLLTFV